MSEEERYSLIIIVISDETKHNIEIVLIIYLLLQDINLQSTYSSCHLSSSFQSKNQAITFMQVDLTYAFIGYACSTTYVPTNINILSYCTSDIICRSYKSVPEMAILCPSRKYLITFVCHHFPLFFWKLKTELPVSLFV